MHTIPHRLRTLTAVGAAVVGLGAFASVPAQASLLGGLLPGILSPKNIASACPIPQQSFKQFGDSTWYQLASGGSFEGQNTWKLSGGASVVADQEPWVVAGAGSQALSLPNGASALSPASCFAFGDVQARMFVKGTGKVRVNVVVSSLLGVLGVLDGGTVQAGQSWQPSPQISLLVSSLGGLLATDAIQLRLTAVDGNAVVDDVYIDPFKAG